MSEYIIEIPDECFASYDTERDMYYPDERDSAMRIAPIVRCGDCKWFNMPDWDNTLAMLYGEPPTTCDLLSHNEWRMDGDRRVAETTFLEVEPDNYCSFGERKVDA